MELGGILGKDGRRWCLTPTTYYSHHLLCAFRKVSLSFPHGERDKLSKFTSADHPFRVCMGAASSEAPGYGVVRGVGETG